jgi:hypothetical protein
MDAFCSVCVLLRQRWQVQMLVTSRSLEHTPRKQPVRSTSEIPLGARRPGCRLSRLSSFTLEPTAGLLGPCFGVDLASRCDKTELEAAGGRPQLAGIRGTSPSPAMKCVYQDFPVPAACTPLSRTRNSASEPHAPSSQQLTLRSTLYIAQPHAWVVAITAERRSSVQARLRSSLRSGFRVMAKHGLKTLFDDHIYQWLARSIYLEPP